ncbi:MAG: phosphatase PAP2 family protein [Candidatus Methylomirabilales bacterium]
MVRKPWIVFATLFLLLPGFPAHAEPEKTVQAREESFPKYLLHELPRNVLQGTQESFTGWNLAILGVGGGAAMGLSQTDADDEVREGADDSIGDFAGIGNIGGHGLTLGGIALSTYILGRVAEEDKVIETGKALIESQIITQALTSLLKVSTGRERPDGSGDRITSSFPSGHASGSFALAATVDAMYGHEIGIPLYLFAGFVGFSRLSDDKHFLSDVVFGAALGTVIGRGVARIHKKEDPGRITILPYSDGRHVALMLTLSW